MSRRLNPWRLFPGSQGAKALAWAEAGNVAVIWNDKTSPRDARLTATPNAMLFAQTPDLVIQAFHALRVRLRRDQVRTDPAPHAPLYGMPLTRARARCKG